MAAVGADVGYAGQEVAGYLLFQGEVIRIRDRSLEAAEGIVGEEALSRYWRGVRWRLRSRKGICIARTAVGIGKVDDRATGGRCTLDGRYAEVRDEGRCVGVDVVEQLYIRLSKKLPAPPRRLVLPSPNTSSAKPTRGMKWL